MNLKEWAANGKPLSEKLNGEKVTIKESDIRVVLDDTGGCTKYFKIDGIKDRTFGVCIDLGDVVHIANVSCGFYELSHPTFFRLCTTC